MFVTAHNLITLAYKPLVKRYFGKILSLCLVAIVILES